MNPQKIVDVDSSFEELDLAPIPPVPIPIQTKMELQKKITKNKSVMKMDKQEVEYIRKSPIGAALYAKAQEENDISIPKNVKDAPKEKYHWQQKVECRYCGVMINKGSYARHRKSKKCQIYQKMDTKIRDLVLK